VKKTEYKKRCLEKR